MAQQLNLECALPCKFQPLILYSLDPPTLRGASVPSHLVVQNEEDNSAAFKSVPQNDTQEDYPDGGLQAWLVVLGVRLSL
jgi:hypothetical protein